MQCVQFVFHSLPSLQKHRQCVKGHKTVPRPQEFYRAGTAPPGSEIPESVTGLTLIDRHILYLLINAAENVLGLAQPSLSIPTLYFLPTLCQLFTQRPTCI